MNKTAQAEQPALPPIQISPHARRIMTERVRAWTGWKNASLVFGPPDHRVSPIAMCDHEKRTVTVDPEFTLLNPNRVLLTVTPFRLRQEAVLTGALLHEAGHARHTHWKPTTVEELRTKPLLHSDDTVPTKQAVALAKLMEEPRIEGLVAIEADDIGATGLGWTMRAMAAHLLPPTELSADPSQALMDIITSWVLRAGRQAALNARLRNTKTPHHLPRWVKEFTSLLHQTIETHLEERVAAGAVLLNDPADLTQFVVTPNYRSLQIIAALNEMLVCDDDTGPTMIDSARDVLAMLFPETDDDSDSGDGQAMAGGGCSMPADAEGDQGKSDEAGEDSEGNTEPEDEGSGDDPGAGDAGSDDEAEPESDDEDSDGDQGPDGADKPADGGSEADSGESEEESGATDSTSPLAKALSEMESSSQKQVEGEAEEKAEETPEAPKGGTSGGIGPGGAIGGSWRAPGAPEREVAKGAERFLRDMIDASETSKRTLTDQPSATVDGGALSAWKAGGQVREPHFFVRTHRVVEPSPPIKIAILVDVSASMDVLQKPSALLSWALASAALDLRNFAGRGQQIESCLIHWGDSTKIIQRPGQVIPGIREVPCNQGTSNMHGALKQIEDVIPGFYDTERTSNRLIVQFTDWKLHNPSAATLQVGRALSAGVNMLSVVPSNYTPRYASLANVLAGCKIQRGVTSLVKYNPGDPGAVWDEAAETLSMASAGTAGDVSREPDEAAAYGF